MSVPGQFQTSQRMAIETTRTAIARQVLAYNQNAQNFDQYLKTLTDPVLMAAPYSYTVDEVYALRRFAEIGAAVALLIEAGGALSADDSTLYMQLVASAAGVWLVSPSASSGF